MPICQLPQVQVAKGVTRSGEVVTSGDSIVLVKLLLLADAAYRLHDF